MAVVIDLPFGDLAAEGPDGSEPDATLVDPAWTAARDRLVASLRGTSLPVYSGSARVARCAGRLP
ncbi:hypothetical protein BN6_19960 [Saccharothrix espanaensis DSM 44229]|uniref:Uncharacterized protein n=1 Tax=Saccharothrix espanaensis (strain ATCC 51144 / DSM 44229 / JCM 9112 / NBRC 15066 / NRRL 15764) TaxID=1179773 RepID=K0JUX3_SACES|nr:hypothetical protein BN6_19960 [Saccharothrix espanaensis DSM 44229]